jgi:probable rRNA maturation factor
MPVRARARSRVKGDLSIADVRRWAGRMLAELGLPLAELSILLTGDQEIRRLNRAYRALDAATDVLAFAMREGDRLPSAEDAELLGDVVISIETAARQAKKARRALSAEARALLAHGLLHLVGWDHQTPRELARMRLRTRRLCRAAVGSGRMV